ncbi:AAA family ATPase [Agrobacterium sp. fls2-241-TYG-188a]|uniref:AAA family ATPase n=1 Tax=Agrobacterium sp. fls2-241-TYG-188a TaxID=3040275 RepID=UPI00254EF6DF|nr:AAA family ATPase [Agrobacterium sp. fls2-241-TYG-188a]
MKIAEIFRTTGQPTITYVPRDSGHYEARLNGYLDERGQLCLITGPSKTGKSTLYKRVLADRGQLPLVVQCTAEKTCADIWKEALASVNFEQAKHITSTSTTKLSGTAEVGGKFGWKWLAEVTGRFSGTVGNENADSVLRERFLADPSPDLLIPILSETNVVLIIEDFHYLRDQEKILLFQQWKRFIDSEVTILVLGTTHRSIDIANSNKDLIGRIAQIDVAQWSQSDLEKIVLQGFGHLKVDLHYEALEKICVEAVGLPIIVQQVCLQLMTDLKVYVASDVKAHRVSKIEIQQVRSAFTNVANGKYSQFGTYYNTLIRGPKEKNRKYKTYELILACFNMDPISFSLTRSEVNARLSKMGLSNDERPPAASLNSTFGALKKFQDKRKFQLLEWMAGEDSLYIVEPSFLFYVRWRINREKTIGIQLDLFELLLENIRTSSSK